MTDRTYDLSSAIPSLTVGSGTNVLVSGPPAAETCELVFDLLADGLEADEGAIVLTTEADAEETIAEVVDRLPGEPASPPIRVVDCVTEVRRDATVEDDHRVAYAASPADVAGIGVELSDSLEELTADRGLSRNRVLLRSISTLLAHADLRTVFRFLSVLTARVRSDGGLGLYVLDPTAHDEATIAALRRPFDGVIEIEPGGRSSPTVRTADLE